MEALVQNHQQLSWPQAWDSCTSKGALGMELVQPLHFWARVLWLDGDTVRMGKGRAWREGGLLAAEAGGASGLRMLSVPGRGLYPPDSSPGGSHVSLLSEGRWYDGTNYASLWQESTGSKLGSNRKGSQSLPEALKRGCRCPPQKAGGGKLPRLEDLVCIILSRSI